MSEQPSEGQNKQQDRQVAFKVRIHDVLSGQYVKRDGWEPNVILLGNNKEVSRTNILCTVVSEPNIEQGYHSFSIDDGTGKIDVRWFEDNPMYTNIALGDVILLVGRPRIYNDMRYIIPEIVKKIENNKWLELRKLELEKEFGKVEIKEAQKEEQVAEPTKEESVVEEEQVIEAKKEEPKADEQSTSVSVTQKIYGLIKEMDKGDGIDTEEIIKKSNIAEAEKIIEALLKEGEIFEPSHGKLKAL